MRGKRRILALIAAVLALFAGAGAALAHPLGNFTISRYSEIVPGARGVEVLYIVDMAEIPTFQEREMMDSDGDGAVNADEEQAYLSRSAPALAAGLRLSAGDAAIPLRLVGQTMRFLPGQGGLPTLRLELSLEGPAGQTDGATLFYEDTNFPDRLGWQEIVVIPGEGAALAESSAPSESISARLTAYPVDLLASPPAVSSATFVTTAAIAPDISDGRAAATEAVAAAGANRFNSDEFANLLNRTLDTPAALAAAMLVAVGLGAAHALTPGHGKTIVGAYLVGSRGTARHALFLGLTTTITHTAGVFALGFIVLFASKYILPEQLYPWLGVLSGLLVMVIGASVLRGHVGHWLAHRRGTAHDHEHYHYHFGKGHHHHPHGPQAAAGPRPEEGSRWTISASQPGGGALALAPAGVPGRSAWNAHAHGDGHTHNSDHAHGHDHGHDHDHTQPAAESDALGWRKLLALGVSGGLLPCPSALVLMLSAIALGQVGLGMSLILAFSIGLAGVLTGIGLILVYAGKLLDRVPVRHGTLTRRVLPVASATFVMLAGLVVTLRAVMEIAG